MIWMLQRPMTLLEFQSKFPTDDACRHHLVGDHVQDDAAVGGDGFGAYRALAEKRATLTMKFDPQNNQDHMT